MELVGSTYNQPYYSGSVTGRNAGESPKEITGTAGVTGNEPGYASSKEISEQMGFQQAGRESDEFTPYSPFGKQEKGRPFDAAESQSGVDVDGVSAKKDDPQLQAQVDQLKAIEEKVKAHEAAHKSAGGAMTGPVSYTYTRGPDGRNYITGGEVPISVSPGKTPQETINRMQQVIQAALAPADPSPQDRAVAAQAAAQQQEARQKLASAASQAATVSFYA